MGRQLATFAALAALLSLDQAQAAPVINEVQVSTSGTDWEFFELAGEPGTTLGGLTLLSIESDADNTAVGRIDAIVHIGGTIPADGFWWAASPTGQATYGATCGTADGSFNDNTFENGSTTNILVSGFTGAVGDDVDLDNDGVIDNVLWSEVLDGVAILDSLTDYAYGFTVSGPDGSYLPSGAFRSPDAAGWSPTFLDFSTPNGTPGASNVSGCVTSPPTPARDYIHDIQGSGAASPLAGTTVTVEAIVVGDFQNNGAADSGDLAGFYLQERDADADADPATSEGIFVYDGSGAVDVAVGDLVRVTGPVSEYYGLTEISAKSVEVLGQEALPTPVDLTLPVTSIDEFEVYEGMRVRFAQPLVVAEYYNFDRYGEIVLAQPLAGEDRPYTPTAVDLPGSAEAARSTAVGV